jgi:fructose 1,6-bisphosphatase
MPLTLSNEDKFDDTNSLEMVIKQTYHRSFEFEIHDVLQNTLSVYPNDPQECDIIQVKSLYKDYTNFSIDEVCTSTYWYRRWALSTERVEENLTLTQNFLVNHCSQGLYEQVFTE